MNALPCLLCQVPRDQIIWEDEYMYVVHVHDELFPAFFRVIWRAHIAEMSDLERTQQNYLMDTVFAVEKGLRALLNPTKINLASLGNQVPHLHWHIIARFAWDSHFPDPIWSSSKRHIDIDRLIEVRQQARQLGKMLPQLLKKFEQVT